MLWCFKRLLAHHNGDPFPTHFYKSQEQHYMSTTTWDKEGSFQVFPSPKKLLWLKLYSVRSTKVYQFSGFRTNSVSAQSYELKTVCYIFVHSCFIINLLADTWGLDPRRNLCQHPYYVWRRCWHSKLVYHSACFDKLISTTVNSYIMASDKTQRWTRKDVF